MVEHAPFTFYDENNKPIQTQFDVKGIDVTFKLLEPVDLSKKIIIDPWVVSATFNSSTAVWAVETDSIG